jgi:hypothetical protein
MFYRMQAKYLNQKEQKTESFNLNSTFKLKLTN